MHICPQEIAMLAPLIAVAGYAWMKAKHAWHWVMRHKRTADEDGCCNYEHTEPEEATLHLGDSTWHDGSGWYYVYDEYPDEGSCGAFSTRDEAIAHARNSGVVAR